MMFLIHWLLLFNGLLLVTAISEWNGRFAEVKFKNLEERAGSNSDEKYHWQITAFWNDPTDRWGPAQAFKVQTYWGDFLQNNNYKYIDVYPWVGTPAGKFPQKVWYHFKEPVAITQFGFRNNPMEGIDTEGKIEERLDQLQKATSLTELSNLTNLPIDFDFIASHDGKKWETLKSIKGCKWDSYRQNKTWTIEKNRQSEYEYYGLSVNSISGGTGAAIWDFKMWIKDIRECDKNPCIHGTCEDEYPGFTCKCFEGFKGRNCEIDIDDCKSNPCIHGTCLDSMSDYTCKCDDGFEGKNCDYQPIWPYGDHQSQTVKCDKPAFLHGKKVSKCQNSDGKIRSCGREMQISNLTMPNNQFRTKDDTRVWFDRTDGRGHEVCVLACLTWSGCQFTTIGWYVWQGKTYHFCRFYDGKFHSARDKTSMDIVLVRSHCEMKPYIYWPYGDRPSKKVECTNDAFLRNKTWDTSYGRRGGKCFENGNNDPKCLRDNVEDLDLPGYFELTYNQAYFTNNDENGHEDCVAACLSSKECEFITIGSFISGEKTWFFCRFFKIPFPGAKEASPNSPTDTILVKDRCVSIDYCKGDPCANGKCLDNGDGFSCECDAGYKGKLCDEDINECEPNPCVHGTCSDFIDDYSCECEEGFEGRNCASFVEWPYGNGETSKIECLDGAFLQGKTWDRWSSSRVDYPCYDKDAGNYDDACLYVQPNDLELPNYFKKSPHLHQITFERTDGSGHEECVAACMRSEGCQFVTIGWWSWSDSEGNQRTSHYCRLFKIPFPGAIEKKGGDKMDTIIVRDFCRNKSG